MNHQRITLREARVTISATLSAAKTATIGPRHGRVRGFIVGVETHNHWDHKARRAALRKAKAAFQEAFTEEWNG